MAIEKNWPATGPFNLTAPGTTTGKLQLTSTLGLKVKQRIQLKDPLLPEMPLEIKRVVGENEIEVGRIGKSITDRVDVSIYGLASLVFAPEQPRNSIPLAEIERAIYEEEPTVARRVIEVDPYGRPYTPNNPEPAALFGTQIAITNNLLSMLAGGVSPSLYLVNNDGFFVFDNEGNFIKAG